MSSALRADDVGGAEEPQDRAMPAAVRISCEKVPPRTASAGGGRSDWGVHRSAFRFPQSRGYRIQDTSSGLSDRNGRGKDPRSETRHDQVHSPPSVRATGG